MASAIRLPAQIWPQWLEITLKEAELRCLITPPIPRPFHQPAVLATQAPYLHAVRSSNRPHISINRPSTSQQLRALSTTRARNCIGCTKNCKSSQNRQFKTFNPASLPGKPTKTCASKGSEDDIWCPPESVSTRPVLILGSGALGRRLAVLWASTSRPVSLYDPSVSAISTATRYIGDTLSAFCAERSTHPGHVKFFSNIEESIRDQPWLVIDCLPENLETKADVMAKVDGLVDADAIFAIDSLSLSSSGKELVAHAFGHGRRAQVVSTLYHIPPISRSVEVMACGHTAEGLIPWLMSEMEEVGLRPIVVDNMVFPRLWTDMKAEVRRLMAEEHVTKEQIDVLFREFFGAERGVCEMMEEEGLGVDVNAIKSVVG